MPRVLISINAAWNVANFRAGLVKALVEDGFEVVAAVPDDGALERVRALGARVIVLPMTSASASVFKDLVLFWRYLRLLRRERPAVYLGWTIKPNTYGSLAARLAGAARINNISGLGTAFIGAGWLRRVAQLLYRVGLSRSATVFFQNADDRDLFLRKGLVRGDQAELLPGSGIDPARFDPANWPGPPGDGAFRFLLIARLIGDKGVREYVAAARSIRTSHPQARFQLLGFLDVDNRTAVSRAELDGWIAEGLIEYLGETEDVRPFIAAADCVVLPSYREGLSRVLLEAAAMQLPAIATDVPGCRDVVVEGQTGLLCRPRDAQDLARRMAEMIAFEPAVRERMGVAARSHVCRNFSEATVIAAYRAALARSLPKTPDRR